MIMAKKEPVQTTTLYVRDVPTDIKNKFHKMCIDEGVSMTKRIIKMMRIAVKRGKFDDQPSEA